MFINIMDMFFIDIIDIIDMFINIMDMDTLIIGTTTIVVTTTTIDTISE